MKVRPEIVEQLAQFPTEVLELALQILQEREKKSEFAFNR